jgi:hypothetical protein
MEVEKDKRKKGAAAAAEAAARWFVGFDERGENCNHGMPCILKT